MCRYARVQRNGSRGASPGPPWRRTERGGQASAEMDGLLREPREERRADVSVFRDQPTDLLSLALPSSGWRAWRIAPAAPAAYASPPGRPSWPRPVPRKCHPCTGRVQALDKNSIRGVSNGNLVGIRHRNGNSSWYAHLTAGSAPFFSELLQGDLSGYSDNTGASDGCHLHFQVHNNHNTPFGGATIRSKSACQAAVPARGSTYAPDR